MNKYKYIVVDRDYELVFDELFIDEYTAIDALREYLHDCNYDNVDVRIHLYKVIKIRTSDITSLGEEVDLSSIL